MERKFGSEPNKDIPPEHLTFEGVKIQWNKVPWNFEHPEIGKTSIDTYSIWNPDNWEEIVERLKKGERCAMYIMGNYGVGEIVQPPEWAKKEDEQYVINDRIKGRDRSIKNVAFMPPEDARDIIDSDWYKGDLKQLRWPGKRQDAYAGPQHNKFRVRKNAQISPSLVREDDQTVANFWIPGHWGYEEIANIMRRKVKHGNFGGSSLNRHGQEPCYTREELFDTISEDIIWQKDINFVISDELAESHQIGRSQTMLNFGQDEITVARQGSLSPEYISTKTGLVIKYDIDKTVKASSLTPYDEQHNRVAEVKVELAIKQIQRYKEWYLKNRASINHRVRK